jgi:methyl-accepting chemotaxis protein
MSTAITASIVPSSRQMPAIVRVIDEIAFQANIIALQMAVAAAEANDAGSPERPRKIDGEVPRTLQ